jgi:hypothetical protein
METTYDDELVAHGVSDGYVPQVAAIFPHSHRYARFSERPSKTWGDLTANTCAIVPRSSNLEVKIRNDETYEMEN